MARSSKQRFYGKVSGFRSGLEDAIAAQLKALGVDPRYESVKLEYTDPRVHKYTPDFPLPNGIFVETKGYFEAADRTKHLLIQKQRPDLDIRFVFDRSLTPIATAKVRKRAEANAKLLKKPPPHHTTYADWCAKHGFKFADKRIPEAWLKEKTK